ncbi:MAG: Tn3 family transposase [Halieaceae bacterium]|jgi:TnpA family transposase|nr:Tn3 family transposase [Halieaceae bacterium]
MAYSERVLILSEAEQEVFYGNPQLTNNDQRYFFALNDKELKAANQFRARRQRCMFVVLLGYFKAKPVVLQPRYFQLKDDLKYVSENTLPGVGHKPFNLSPKESERIYQRIFSLCQYERWRSELHEKALMDYLQMQAMVWSEPRCLFDAAVEYLSNQKIALPAYSTLQKIISQIIISVHSDLVHRLNEHLSDVTRQAIAALLEGKGEMSLRQLRQSARNFTSAEIAKELAVHRHVAQWMPEVSAALDALALSQKNQQHFAERVDYYGAKLKRQSIDNQRLYLLCYLQQRWQQAQERIADALVHHVRHAKQKAKRYAQESVAKDWRKAEKNVIKAADVLRLFIDDPVDEKQPFGAVRQNAFDIISKSDLESVCLFLYDQRRSIDEATWQYYEQRDSLRVGLIRELFMCLRLEGNEGSERLAHTLSQAQAEFAEHNELSQSAYYKRYLPHKQREFLQDKEGNLKLKRYEWYLYLQIPSRLNGKLTLPGIAKYQAFEADLVDTERWKKDKELLVEQTQLPKLAVDPVPLIQDMEQALDSRLRAVSDYLDKADNRNVVLRNPKGKRSWRLPAGSKSTMVNNPFFSQLPTTAVADVLRMVDRDTGFIECFRHVLGTQSKNRVYEQDLLAILVGNATNQGTYGISQISDRSYEQLSTIQANYLRSETIEAANDCINNATARLPIFKHYNIQEDVVHASADGQKFEAKRDTFKTRYSSKYFGTQKGVSALSLIVNHAATNAKIIGANEHESHYIFDLLFNNTSEVKPDVLSTDTHGVNHVNFALLDLFGYSFAPRYAQPGRIINEMFAVTEDEAGKVNLSLRTPINTKCIARHWDKIQRIVVSLKERKTTQALLVRKLSTYKKNHPLLEALTEYNHLVKANYLLNYIDDADLRNHVQRALNRGEAYHQLRRAISDVNGDRFRGNSDEEIQLWNECARLLTNAIIYFNSSVLSYLLKSFEYQKDGQKLAIVKQASPVAWYNINLKGTYRFKSTGKLPDFEQMMRHIEGYRPVR